MNMKIFTVLMLALTTMPCFDAKAYDCDGISEKAVNCSINNETGKCSGDNLYFGRLKQQADIQFRQIIDKDILQSKNREKIQKAQKDKKTYVLSKVKEYCQELVTAGTKAAESEKTFQTSGMVATAQKNTLTTATNSAPVYAEEEPEIVQGEVMTLPKEYETNSSRGNAVASGSPRANINSIVASDVEKQAQESNNQSSISSANRGLTVSGGPTTKTTQKSAQGTNCPNGTKYDTKKQKCIYEKQPISSSTNNCFVYSFSYYTSLSGELLKEQDKYFTQWQNACKNLASCKHAKEMIWVKDGKRGLNASDQADIYYCDPKICLDGSQPKDYKCPEKNQNIENAKTGECKDSYFGVGKYDENGKCKIEKCSDEKNYTLNTTKNKCELKTTANIREKSEARKEAKAQSAAEKKYESDINELIDAYNTVMKKFVSECTSDGKTFKKTGCEG